MKLLYKCEFCDKMYNTKKEATDCENSCCKVEELACLNYYIIKFAYPRLKRMSWYKEDSALKRQRLLFLMEEFLYNENRDYCFQELKKTMKCLNCLANYCQICGIKRR